MFVVTLQTMSMVKLLYKQVVLIQEMAQNVVLPGILVEGVTTRKKGHKVKISEEFPESAHLRSISPNAELPGKDARRKLLETRISEQGENINTLKQVTVGKCDGISVF